MKTTNKYRVYIEYSTIEYNSEYFTILADNEDDASDKAIEEFNKMPIEYEDYEVENIRFIETTEIHPPKCNKTLDLFESPK